MALIPGPKQSFSASITGAGSAVGAIRNCLGAKAIIVKSYASGNSATLTLAAANSFDGVNPATGIGLTCSGAGASNGVGRLATVITITGATSLLMSEIPTPYIVLTAGLGSGTTTTIFEVWPLFEANHPNLGLGGGALPT